MSKLDSFFYNVGDLDRDLDLILPEEDLNVSPSWAAEVIENNTFPLHSQSFKAKLPQALPSLPLDCSYFNSPRAKGNSFRRRATEEQKFYSPSPLCFGEVEAFGNSSAEMGSQATMNWRNSSAEMCSGNYCPGGSIGSLLEQSSSSDDSEDDSCREGDSEDTVDGKWNGVLQLVKNLNHRFSKCKNTGTKKVQKLKMSEEILIALLAIHQNVEKIKAVVPSMAGQGAKFTADLHRQCTAAAGAVKQISQLADAAGAMAVEIERQLDAVPSDPGYDYDGMCYEKPPSDSQAGPEVSSVLREDGKLAESVENTDRTAPALPTFLISPTNVPLVEPVIDPVVEVSNCSDQENNLATATPFELQCTENDYVSSLVADLFSPCDTGADAFADPSTVTSSPMSLGQWGNDLEESIRNCSCVSQLKPESFLLESPSIFLPSRTAGGGGAAAEPTPGDASGAAGQDESDDGSNEAGDQLPSGSFTLMEIDDSELLTEQTHYCNICSKGFKRDANLRMHMRSHGGKYKSLTALVGSERAPKLAQETVSGGESTRYSCPSVGCSRNIKHPQFQPLKTMLCLKNHYRRSHCAKTLQCSKCKSKQFSVLADLKTHEKHCGSADRWACSCGTTFSRKEKLHGHVRLFVGHVPVDVSTRGSGKHHQQGRFITENGALEPLAGLVEERCMM